MMEGKANIDTSKSECIYWTVKALLEQRCPKRLMEGLVNQGELTLEGQPWSTKLRDVASK